MQLIKTTLSPEILHGDLKIGKRRIPRKVIFPTIIALLVVVGLLSPLFDLHHIHGFPGAKLYTQHLFFDGIADAGGFYASSFCKHWYHKVPIAVGFALISTFALVTLVG
jgi:hypothetical protein